MNYYKTYYSDNTFSHFKSKTPICSPKQICDTCTKVENKSAIWYIKECIIDFLL